MTTSRFLTLLLLSSQLVSQASAQRGDGHLGVTPAPSSRAFVGEVTCNEAGEPDARYLDSLLIEQHAIEIDRAETLRHEAVHLAQLTSDCRSTMARWVVDPAARLEAEIEATCGGIRTYSDPARRAKREEMSRGVLAMLYAGEALPVGPDTTNYGYIWSRFDHWCRP